MSSQENVLLITDSKSDVEEVVGYFQQSRLGLKLHCIYVPEAGRRLLSQAPAEILLLGFHTIEAAQGFHERLLHGSEAFRSSACETILLCGKEETEEAARLVRARLVDDYFVFKPIYDPFRLQTCFVQALERRRLRAKTTNLLQVAAEGRSRSGRAQELVGKAVQAGRRLRDDSGTALEEARSRFDEALRACSKEIQSELEEARGQAGPEVAQCLERQFRHRLDQELRRLNKRLQKLQDEWIKKVEEYRLPKPRPRQPDQSAEAGLVLVVDDDYAARELMMAILQPRGYHFELAENGYEALMKVAKRLPDIAIVDLFMPGMDGIELTRRLKSDPATESLPVIVTSSHSTKEKAILSKQVGAEAFAVKPLNSDFLLKTVDELFE